MLILFLKLPLFKISHFKLLCLSKIQLIGNICIIKEYTCHFTRNQFLHIIKIWISSIGKINFRESLYCKEIKVLNIIGKIMGWSQCFRIFSHPKNKLCILFSLPRQMPFIGQLIIWEYQWVNLAMTVNMEDLNR